MARSDIHRPSAIVPADYDFVGFNYLPVDGDISGFTYVISERAKIAAHMASTGGHYGNNESAGSCYCCGAHARYLATFHHRSTNSYIKTGLDCAAHMEMGDAAAFRRRVGNALEAVSGKRKAKAFLATQNLSAAWDVANAPCPTDERGNVRFEEATTRDIVQKLVRFGSISEKQVAFLHRLMLGIANRATQAAQRAAAAQAAAPCPSGKVQVTGTVLSTRTQDGAYGPQLKMLVQHADGWKVWGSVPAALRDDAVRGATVTFTATVTPSQDDQKFGFFSRPKVVAQSTAPAAEVAAEAIPF